MANALAHHAKSWLCPNIPVLLLLLALLAPPLTAKHKKIVVQTQPAKSYPHHSEQEKLLIAADPYLEAERKLLTFDKEMEKKGILPIYVLIENAGKNPISINGNAFQLLDRHQAPLNPLSLEDLLQVLYARPPGNKPKWPTTPIPLPQKSGSSAMGLDEAGKDLMKNSLGIVRLNPQETTAGFVFFKPDKEIPSLQGYQLYIPEIRDLETGKERLFFEIELGK